jgi:branched-chain amino acid aminotransferase
LLWAGPLRNWCFQRRIVPEERFGFEECFVSGTGAEVTSVSEAGPCKFTPGAISRAMIDDYSAEVRPKQKAA